MWEMTTGLLKYVHILQKPTGFLLTVRAHDDIHILKLYKKSNRMEVNGCLTGLLTLRHFKLERWQVKRCCFVLLCGLL